jgi:hypothetical protein
MIYRFTVVEMVSMPNPLNRLLLLLGVLMLSLGQPWALTHASAGLTSGEGGGDLYLSCREDNDCVLTPTPIGEEVVSGQSSANTFQTETVTFEFEADPPQDHVALLPERIALMEIDFRHQTEAGSLFRPALDARLILGESVNDWSFAADVLPQTTASPYVLEDESLSLGEGRVLWEDEPLRLVLTFTLDRPGTWALNMRGASMLQFEVPWSIDLQTVDRDEPSSTTQPRSTNFEDLHRGALVGADHDCWAFEVETHEVLRLLVEWEQVPLELEQPHPVPDFITAAGRRAPAPEVLVDDDGSSVKMTYRWRALSTGDYTLCMHGSAEKVQPYVWSGIFGYESMGPTDPSGFGSASYYPQGAALLGDLNDPYTLHGQGLALLLLSLAMLGVFLLVALRPTTSYNLRFGMFIPGAVLLLLGGVLHPLWAMADEVQKEEEITLNTLIEMRLQQLWDVSADGVPDQTLSTHTGATWGMLDGETLRLKLTIEEAIPLEDGRWQLVVPELSSLRLDQAIFGQVAKGQTYQSDDGMLESQTVRFVLLAGRSLLLDLLMLEALLVVEDVPQSSVFHIETTMVETQAAGSFAAPAWGTRPESISAQEWVRLQGSLFPERISISLCDCDLDLLDVTFMASNGFDAGDLPQAWGLRNAVGLLPYGSVMMWSGLVLGATATTFEVQRASKAQRLADTYRPKGGQWN